MSTDERNARLADQLVKQDVITREELEQVKARERETGVPWYRQLLQMRKVNFGALDPFLKREFNPKAAHEEHRALGDTLLEMKAITQEQLNQALAIQKKNGRLLGNILLDQGIITMSTWAHALSRQHNLDFAPLAKTASQREALDAVPESLALKHGIIPIKIKNNELSVLIGSPEVASALPDVGIMLGKRITPIMTDKKDLREEIRLRYSYHKSGSEKPIKKETESKTAAPEAKKAPAAKGGKSKEKERAKKGEEAVAERKITEVKEPRRFDEIAKQAQGAPVIKLVSTLIEGAINSGATDIHLDPQEPEMRARYRIDGVLHDVMSIHPDIEPAVVSRIKILADMDITETRRPQDGHISLEIGNREIDVRVATMPTYLGERVVLRLLDQTSVLAGIKDLGLEQEDEETLMRLIQQPYGMILVTGPTGSGKTTTLYAALNQKNVMTESIVTLEDPVEYQLSGINQVQIDTDIDLTFAVTLRAALRQDIDVLLVGEIRDAETARIAIRAAMTGHLVFSTLHTNDAPEAISTLRNMGVPSYLIASALTAVIGQRLVRKICENCKTSFVPTKNILQSVGLPTTVKKLWRGTGCDKCYGTGTRGRTGIFELLEVTPEIRRMIVADEPIEKIAKAAKLKTMAERCRLKLKRGEVQTEDFLRVIRT